MFLCMEYIEADCWNSLLSERVYSASKRSYLSQCSLRKKTSDTAFFSSLVIRRWLWGDGHRCHTVEEHKAGSDLHIK